MSNVLEWLVGLLQCRHRFFPLCFSLSLMLVTAEGSVAAQSATSTQTNPSGTQTYAITAKVIAGGGTMIARSPCFELAGTIDFAAVDEVIARNPLPAHRKVRRMR